jgi:hypothetical protein
VNSENRIGHNEAVFRDINERIEAGQWTDDLGKPVAFRCECASLGCNMLIELTLAAYQRVRADSRRFVLVPGHELAGVESVVEREAQYVVVEKEAQAGRVAEATDPRDD